MIDAYIGLGGNLGDRVANLSAALRALSELPDTEIVAVSHAYETEPWGVEHQPDFVNAVARIRTGLYADQLLSLLKDIEEEMGRKRADRFGPRPIDLDILLFGDEEWGSEKLTIPHPRLSQRDFVLAPLFEIEPDIAWPNGDPIIPEPVVVGRVIADLGSIPGAEQLVRRTGEWSGGKADEDWVPVGGSRAEWGGGNTGTDFDLLYYEALLKDAEIPCEFYPHRPNEGAVPTPYGPSTYVRIVVPASRAEEAEQLIDEASKARPVDE